MSDSNPDSRAVELFGRLSPDMQEKLRSNLFWERFNREVSVRVHNYIDGYDEFDPFAIALYVRGVRTVGKKPGPTELVPLPGYGFGLLLDGRTGKGELYREAAKGIASTFLYRNTEEEVRRVPHMVVTTLHHEGATFAREDFERNWIGALVAYLGNESSFAEDFTIFNERHLADYPAVTIHKNGQVTPIPVLKTEPE